MADPRIAEAFVEIRPDTSGFRRATQTQVRTQLAPIGAGLRGAGLGAIAATSAVAGLTTAVTILGVKTIKAGIDFESSFAGVRKTVDATEAEFAALSDSFRELAREIPINVNQLNELGEAAGALGIQKGAIVDFVEVAAQLGVTTNLAAQDAANALARIANITQLPQDQFDNLGATIVDLGNKMATTEAELVEFGLRIAGAGKIAGLTEPQILAIGATLSSMGVEAEAGGTAVQKVLINMSNAAKVGGKSATAFAKIMGTTVAEFQNLQRTDPQAAFQRFVQGLHDIEASGGAATIALDSVGLADQRLIRSFLALSGNTELLDQAFRTANDAFRENTALTEEARKRFETTSAQIQLLKNNLNDIAISISTAMLPSINQAIGGISSLVDRLRDSGDAGRIGEEIGAAFDLVKRVFNALRPDFERLIGVIQRNIETWRILIRTMRPITILVGATLVVAFKAAVRAIDLVSQAMSILVKGFREGVQIIVGAVRGILGAMSSLADAGSRIPLIGGQFEGVSDAINGVREDLDAFSRSLDLTNGKQVNVSVKTTYTADFVGPIPPGATITPGAPIGGERFVPRGTTTGGTPTTTTPRGSQVPSALRTELTSATRAREQRLLDEAELARLSAETKADDRRTLNALVAFYRELANSDRFTVAAKRAFLIEQQRFQGEIAQLDADAAQAAKDAADADKQAREDAADARADQLSGARADRLEILQTNLELARLTQANLRDDRRALRALIAYWHEIARLKSLSAVERRRAVLSEKQAIADLKTFNQQAVRNRISEQESLLRDRLTLAQLTDKTTKDDANALRKLIAFYRKQSRNQKLTRAERRKYLIDLRRTQKELRDLGSGGGPGGTGPTQAQRNFEFLGSLQGVFRDFGSNFFQPGQISVGRVDPSSAGRMKSLAAHAKLPGIQKGERTSMASEAAEKLREGRGMTGAQAAELIHLQRQTVRLLADLHRGAGHPENRYATHSARAAMDHRE